MTRYHSDLTPERWQKFSLMEQLANVGCDIGRTVKWKQRGDLDASQKAFGRALELLDLTIDDPKNKEKVLQDLLRDREMLIDHFVNGNTFNTTDEFWDDYFFKFCYAAAIERGR